MTAQTLKSLSLAALVAALAAYDAASAVPLRWTVETSRPGVEAFDAYHGESLDLQATMLSYGDPLALTNAPAMLYWQTNGMGKAWWSVPASCSSNVLSASFAPHMDPGASVVNGFIGVAGQHYRASFRLHFRNSPGADTANLPLPVRILDFDTVEVQNAPYYTKQESDERMAGKADAVRVVPGEIVSCGWYDGEVTLDWHEGEAQYQWWNQQTKPRLGGVHYLGYDNGWWRFKAGSISDEYDYTNAVPVYGFPPTLTLYQSTGDTITLTRTNEVYSTATAYPVVYMDDLAAAATAATNYTDEAIANIEIPDRDLTDYATHAQATNAARAVSAPLEENVGVLWQYVLGDTVWFAVTNYMRTVEGVVPSLQLWEVRDGATNLVYHSTEEITNFVNAATAALRADLTNSLADRAWSKYQSATGADNPQPGEITIVSTPSVMLTGGGEWNRYVNTGGSAVWVLKSNGLATFGGGTNGTFFAVQDDEGNSQFEIKRTDSYEVDAIASSCGWDQSGNFQVTYNLPASGNPPTLYASTNLATTAFAPEENGTIDSLGIDVSWAASGGLWQATITQDVTAPALFVHAKALQEGSIVVRNKAATDLQGGIFIGNTKYSIGTATISGHTVLTLTPAP